MARTAVDLVVNIIAKGSGNLQKVSGDLNKMDRSLSRNAVTQAAAAQRASVLNQKMSDLGKEVFAGTKTTKQAAVEFDKFKGSLPTFEVEESTSKMDLMKGAMGKVAIAAGAVSVALVAAKKAFDFAAEGRQLQLVEDRFKTLTAGIGGYEKVLRDLNRTTFEQVSDTELMAAAQGLLQAEIVTSNADLQKHFEIVSKLKKPHEDFGSALENWTLLMANQSILRLDSYGISAGKVKTRMAELRDTQKDLTKEQRFNIAVMEEAENTMKRVGDAVPVDEFAQLKKETDDLTDSLKISAAQGLGPVVKTLNRVIDSTTEWGKDVDTLKAEWKAGNLTLDQYIVAITTFDGSMERAAERIRDVAAGGELNDKILQKQAQSTIDLADATEELTEEQIELKEALSDYQDIQKKNLANLDAEQFRNELREKILRKNIIAQHEWTDAQKEEAKVQKELIAIDFPTTLSLFNEELEDLGPHMVMVGGRTADQNRILEEAKQNYDRTTEAIHDYQVGLRGFGMDADEVSEKIGELEDQQAHWNRLIEDYSGIQGEAKLATVEATRSQEKINEAFLAGIIATEDNKEQVLGLKIALGELTEEQAAAIVEQWNMQEAILAIQEAWQNGSISNGSAVEALKLVGQGFIDDKEDAEEFIEKVGDLQEDLDELEGHYKAEVEVEVHGMGNLIKAKQLIDSIGGVNYDTGAGGAGGLPPDSSPPPPVSDNDTGLPPISSSNSAGQSTNLNFYLTVETDQSSGSLLQDFDLMQAIAGV